MGAFAAAMSLKFFFLLTPFFVMSKTPDQCETEKEGNGQER